MKLEELEIVGNGDNNGTNLYEMFNTIVGVTWTESNGNHIGTFELDNHVYTVHLERIPNDIQRHINLSKDYFILDFGFKRDNSWDIVNDSNTSSSKVLGAVFHAFNEKIKQLKPEMILFGLNYKNGAVESRRTLYNRLGKWYEKGSSYEVVGKWIKTVNGEFQLLSRVKIPKTDFTAIENLAKSIKFKE